MYKGKRREAKITNVEQMNLIDEYPEEMFDKKALKDLLEYGQIYEFKRGWFKKI